MRLILPLAAALLLSLAAAPARSGQNAGATARLYWLTSNTVASTGNNSTAAVAKCLVTLKGVKSLRGVDVQLWVDACDLGGLPPAWQCQSGGCADGNFTALTGGFNSGTSTVWPNMFTTDPGLPGLRTDAGMHCGPGDCWSPPHGLGMIRFSATGTAGVARQSATEYGVFGFRLDLTTGCGGDVTDPNLVPVFLCPVLRDTCHAGCHGIQIAVRDSTGARDYVPFEQGYWFLTWFGQLSPGGCLLPVNISQACQAPAAPTTWGRIRRLYR